MFIFYNKFNMTYTDLNEMQQFSFCLYLNMITNIFAYDF